MKRLWTTEPYREQQQRRRRKEELRRRNRGDDPIRGSGEEVVLAAPDELSVFDHPEQSLAFCNALRAAVRGYNVRVWLDLEGVTRVSSDALFVIRAIMDVAPRGWRTNVGGNLPADPAVAAKFKASGFFSGFAKPPSQLPPPTGLILCKSHRRVFSDIAAELVRFAQRNANVPRALAHAASHTLIEAMTNTRGHAGEQRRLRSGQRHIHQPWSAGVYCEAGVAHFTFVDLGVGILRSAPTRRYLKILGIPIGPYGKPRLLEDAFCGIIGSSTGLPGRGLGLPRMRTDAQAQLLPKLQVLTSEVIGSVADLQFTTISESLRGTVLRWRSG